MLPQVPVTLANVASGSLARNKKTKVLVLKKIIHFFYVIDLITGAARTCTGEQELRVKKAFPKL